MESRRGNGNAADDGLDSAGEAARRMQVMIQDAVAVLAPGGRRGAVRLHAR
jgi:hypothetical protein